MPMPGRADDPAGVTGARWPLARACLQQGRLAETAAICREIVRDDPRDSEAWQLLGVIALRTGDPRRAVEALQRSLHLKPDQAVTLTNLGAALRAGGRVAEALRSYDEALALEPRLVEALNNRASALIDLGRFDEALGSCEQALQYRPDYPEALNNRGNSLRGLGRTAEALASFDRALELNPLFAAGCGNRAAARLDLGQPGAALEDCDRALQIDARCVAAHNNRGTALRHLCRLPEALASYERALQLQPGYADAEVNRGNLLRELGRAGEALASFERALALKPDLAAALSGRAELLAESGRYQEAAICTARLLELAPDWPFAAGLLMQCRLQECDWTDYDARVTRLLAAVERGDRAVAPFWCLALSDSARLQRRCARTFLESQQPPHPAPLAPRRRGNHPRIRVAYLSADFREHPVSRLLAGVFEQHDRERFDVSAVSSAARDRGALGRRVAAAFGGFHDISRLTDSQAAEMLRELEVDILVDLLGYTQGLRPGLLTLRPAAIQVNYLGYPGTLGADCMDYIIADEFVIPADAEDHYSEHVVRLPGSFQANDARRAASGRSRRAQAGLPEDGPVLCCFNTSHKLTPPVFDIWMRLLGRCAGSVLWLLAGSSLTRSNLAHEASRRGIAPERIVFAPRLPYAEHLARLSLADLYLDTLPFNGGASASDALWAGVPVLTCAGEAFASRMAGSLLHALCLPELIAHDLEQYERVGHELLAAPERLAAVRGRLTGGRAEEALFNTQRFCRELEAAYQLMWARYERGEPAGPFAVPALRRP
jgi:predicted O-linked N-acetylglucosamine transferase (SPINDLY family)